MPVAAPDPALGFQAKFAIGATAVVDKPLDFQSEDLGLREVFLDPQGMRGTRSHAAVRVRPAGRAVTGSVTMAPTALEWSYLLPYIAGGAAVVLGTGNTYALTEAFAAFWASFVRGDSAFLYSGCRVSRATITAQKGSAVQLAVEVMGVEEAKAAAGTFPALTLDNTSGYFILEDSNLGVIVNGTTIDCFSLTVVIDNFVQARQVNSQTATVVYSTDRVVSWRIEVPWGDDETMYGLAQGGVPVSATFVNANLSLSFTSPKVQFPRSSPDVQSRDEIRNVLTGIARYSVVPNDELVVFLDHAV